jgi:hypothetical protein
VARRVRSKAKSREARGYGPAHRTRRRILRPMVEAGLTYCARCGERILRGEPWDLGHDDSTGACTSVPSTDAATGAQRARSQPSSSDARRRESGRPSCSGQPAAPLQASFTYGVSST